MNNIHQEFKIMAINLLIKPLVFQSLLDFILFLVYSHRNFNLWKEFITVLLVEYQKEHPVHDFNVGLSGQLTSKEILGNQALKCHREYFFICVLVDW